MKKIAINPIEYQLVSLLGEGLSGCVYKAKRSSGSIEIPHDVALKILNSQTDIFSWRQEIEQGMRVKSQHCASIYGWEVSKDQLMIVSQFINGVTLEQYTKFFRLTDDEIREILMQAAHGLKDLRDAGVCHGDISLGNLMIDTRGTVVWIDFSRPASSSCLTPAYAAPEVLSGEPPHYLSDLYGLGRMFYDSSSVALKRELEHCLLLNAPGGRKPILTQSSSGARKRLGEKVVEVQKWEESVQKTQILKPRRFNSSIRKIFLRPIVAMGVAFCAFGLVGEEKSPLRAGSVSIISYHWMEIWIDGVYLGYTPVTDKELNVGRHKIRWKTAKGSGVREISLRPGDHKVLKDKDF